MSEWGAGNLRRAASQSWIEHAPASQFDVQALPLKTPYKKTPFRSKYSKDGLDKAADP